MSPRGLPRLSQRLRPMLVFCTELTDTDLLVILVMLVMLAMDTLPTLVFITESMLMVMDTLALDTTERGKINI